MKIKIHSELLDAFRFSPGLNELVWFMTIKTIKGLSIGFWTTEQQ